jgi:hypothetical protein
VNPTKPDSHASHHKTLTNWYPADVKPVREGVYETMSPLFGDTKWFSRWNGHQWMDAFYLNKEAAAATRYRAFDQDRPWRGLTEQAK